MQSADFFCIYQKLFVPLHRQNKNLYAKTKLCSPFKQIHLAC